MNSTMIFIGALAVGLIIAFIGNYNGYMHDAEADGKPHNFWEWALHSAIQIALSVVIILPMVANIDAAKIAEFEALASGLTGGVLTGMVAQIVGALVTGFGIPTLVTRVVMPLFSLAGAKTAKQKNREKSATK